MQGAKPLPCVRTFHLGDSHEAYPISLYYSRKAPGTAHLRLAICRVSPPAMPEVRSVLLRRARQDHLRIETAGIYCRKFHLKRRDMEESTSVATGVLDEERAL